jgi:hypothetical protein
MDSALAPSSMDAVLAEADIVCSAGPGIVLGFGACSNADDTDANSQHEQQEPHSRLLGWPLSYKCPLSRFIPYPCAMRRGGLRLTSPKLPELLSRAIRPSDCPALIHGRGFFVIKANARPQFSAAYRSFAQQATTMFFPHFVDACSREPD